MIDEHERQMLQIFLKNVAPEKETNHRKLAVYVLS